MTTPYPRIPYGEASFPRIRYPADEGLRRRLPTVRHVGLAVVFHGWEMAACEAVGEAAGDSGRP